MRLTTSDREAFVRAAMDDVPEVDYGEKIRKLVMDHLHKTVPQELQEVIVKYPEWFEARRINTPDGVPDFNTKLTCRYVSVGELLKDAPGTLEKVRELAREAKTQSAKRTELRRSLSGAIAGVNTLKQALEILPEFAKYLPQERDGKVIRSMPVIANLVADLTAAGWPKGKQNAKKTAAR